METVMQKLPAAVQVLLGFAVVVLGIFFAVYGNFWSQGDLRFNLVFTALAVIFLLIGLTPMVEGIMTMNHAIEESKKVKDIAAPPAEKRK